MIGGLFFSKLSTATEFIATMPGINLRFVTDININNVDIGEAGYVLAIVRDTLTVSAVVTDYISFGAPLGESRNHTYQFILGSGDRIMFGTSAGGLKYTVNVYAREYLGPTNPYA
ncbi:MAG: hypothetical protein ACRD98_00645 [Nitrososphaera sp.]